MIKTFDEYRQNYVELISEALTQVMYICKECGKYGTNSAEELFDQGWRIESWIGEPKFICPSCLEQYWQPRWMIEKIYKVCGYPTKVGIKKYLPYGVHDPFYEFDSEAFKEMDDEDIKYLYKVCTCNEDCKFACKGECGCQACYSVYLEALEFLER